MSHKTKPIPSLQSVCPDVSPPLDAIFRRMVAKTPAERCGTMAEVIADLEPFRGWLPHSSSASTTSGIGVATAPVARPAAARSWWRVWRILTATGTGGLLLILLGIWLIVRDKDGNEVARVRVPEGGSVVQEPDRPAAQPSAPTAESAPAAVKTATPPPRNLPPGAPPPAVAPFDAVQAKKHQAAWAKYLGVPVEMQNSIGMKFMLIPPGEFDMGSAKEEVIELLEEAKTKKMPAWYTQQLPTQASKHRVRITKPFYLGTTEVTQAEYERVMGTNPSRFKESPTCPVEQITWVEASAFCRKHAELAEEQTSRAEYRLPSEAEWEYACRAGTTTTWYSGNDDKTLQEHAWFMPHSGGRTHPVGLKTPNAWGVYDMHGNVWECCQELWGDAYYTTSPIDEAAVASGGSYRATRGGSWNDVASICRASFSYLGVPSYRGGFHGFRVVRNLPCE